MPVFATAMGRLENCTVKPNWKWHLGYWNRLRAGQKRLEIMGRWNFSSRQGTARLSISQQWMICAGRSNSFLRWWNGMTDEAAQGKK